TMLADRLWTGQPVRPFYIDWLSSDRPPLQAGWLLLNRPWFGILGLDPDTVAGAGGVCFQLLWVPAIWALLRRVGARPAQAAAVVAALAFSGYFLVFTTFTWPKLAAGALVLTGFLLAVSGPRSRGLSVLAGAFVSLGWLSHGGIAFSLIGLAPLAVAARSRRRGGLSWRWAAAGFLGLALPWLAFLKFRRPP